ncbi:MAG: hypothetical protein H6709_04750 [Kofleriaceae bacterium]|nr:hypothetical protein [Kofleriaceae bacterium]MCB9571379.1 hypothetical protein [Kofleriaceae bacterium]
MSVHDRPRMFKVLCPIEKKDGGGTFWMRIGTGFPNKDQSINLYLDALPINQKLQLREMDEEDLRRSEARRAERRSGSGGGGALRATGTDDLPF